MQMLLSSGHCTSCSDSEKKRLRKFYEENLKMHNEMREYYEFNTDDTFWLCRHKLKEYGIDIEEWYKEDNP